MAYKAKCLELERARENLSRRRTEESGDWMSADDGLAEVRWGESVFMAEMGIA